MNGPVPTILIDQRWLDHEGMTHLYHAGCVAKMAKFYRMPNPGLRYRPYTGQVAESAQCDFCSKSLLWDLAEHLVEVDRPGPPARLGRGD
jgi:hypothetical protein